MAEQTEDRQRRNTRQRDLVLDIVRSRCDHPTADAVYWAARKNDAHISKGTVYRNLRLLSEAGEIKTVHAKGKDRFDVRCDAHAHLVCRSCGKVVDAPIAYDKAADADVGRESGFAEVAHDTTFEGLCPECAKVA